MELNFEIFKYYRVRGKVKLKSWMLLEIKKIFILLAPLF